MNKTTRRMLEALHGGLVLHQEYTSRIVHDYVVHAMTWEIEPWGSHSVNASILPIETPKGFIEPFTYSQFDGLLMEDLVQRAPNCSSKGTYVLSQKGLVIAQEIFGPVNVDVLVADEDGAVWRIRPDSDGPAVFSTDELVLRDSGPLDGGSPEPCAGLGL